VVGNLQRKVVKSGLEVKSALKLIDKTNTTFSKPKKEAKKKQTSFRVAKEIDSDLPTTLIPKPGGRS